MALGFRRRKKENGRGYEKRGYKKRRGKKDAEEKNPQAVDMLHTYIYIYMSLCVFGFVKESQRVALENSVSKKKRVFQNWCLA